MGLEGEMIAYWYTDCMRNVYRCSSNVPNAAGPGIRRVGSVDLCTLLNG